MIMTENEIDNKTCALALIDSLEHGLNDLEVVTGKLTVQDEELKFKAEHCKSFAVPIRWKLKLLPVPVEKRPLFRSCSYFIPVQKNNAKWILKVFSKDEDLQSWIPGCDETVPTL